jgi:hypothetical protein
MVSLLLATSILPFNSKDGLTFTYRVGDDLTFLSIDHGKSRERVTSCLRVGLMRESAVSAHATVQLGEIENGQRMTLDFLDGRKIEVDRPSVAKDNWRSVGIASSERFLLEYVQQFPSLDVTTTIYRIGSDRCTLICSVPGRVVDIFGSTIISAVSKNYLVCSDIAKPSVEQNQTALSKNLKAIYAARSRTAHHDPFRFYDFEEVRVSPDGKYWFEANHNFFGLPEPKKLIYGDVILSQKGIAWQWKSNRPNLRGAYFLNGHTFRFFRTAKFMMGSNSLKSYDPGAYEVNLQTNRVKKLSTDPIPLKTLLLKNGRLRAQ